jgi:hypothetical protein
VLASEPGGDYLNGSIEMRFRFGEDANAGFVTISGDISVTHPEVRGLIQSGEIRCVVAICSLETYFVEHHHVDLGEFKIDIPGGKLRGTVSVRAILEVTSEELVLPPNDVNPEFDETALRVSIGDLAGFGDEFRFEAGFDKLVPLESVFQLIKSQSIEEPRFEISTEGQAVQIFVSPQLYDQIVEMRNSTASRNILLASLYLPCLIELLSIAHTDPQPESRWYQAVLSRCNQLGIALDGRDLATNAQRMLANPLGLLYSSVEGLH